MNFIKIKHPNATVICQSVELDEQAKVLLRNSTTPAQYMQQMLERELYPDAVRFLAHALPKLDATWWACQCARHVLTEQSPPEELHALKSAEAWVNEPTDENRKLTMPAAVATQFKTPASWAAVAAFWSGGHIPSPDGPFSKPVEDLAAKAVIGAVMTAAITGKSEQTKHNFQLFLQKGIDIARGGDGCLDG